MARLNIGLGAVAAAAAACLITGGIVQTAHADPVMGDPCNPATDRPFTNPQGVWMNCSEFPNVGTVWAETHTMNLPTVSRGARCVVGEDLTLALDSTQNQVMTCVDEDGDGRSTWQPAE
ncbi:hypothetical protein [Nocardia aurantia]|uniref:Ricin B lectin domain-containing protein n=1 Tax=Nocardia aurantia TaxID=2585199 RepID=A0A7K0DYV1_9NOCA|nr:hypothetical protein [Nocardia aurantia]MQY30986.1 hypothetical protein [Nocardia aurantia]